jgi:hypothetical protein
MTMDAAARKRMIASRIARNLVVAAAATFFFTFHAAEEARSGAPIALASR